MNVYDKYIELYKPTNIICGESGPLNFNAQTLAAQKEPRRVRCAHRKFPVALGASPVNTAGFAKYPISFTVDFFFIVEPYSGSMFNATLGSKSLVLIHIGCFQKASRFFGMEMDLVRGCNYEPQYWIHIGLTPLILSNTRYIIYP